MNFWVALSVYVVFMSGYWFFVWSIHWHAREYILPRDPSLWVTEIFLATAVTLSVVSFALFFTLPLTF